jgi:cytidylate kinase
MISVITIARTFGAGGEALGQQLAKSLGLRYVDSEIIDAAAERANVGRAVMVKAEARKSLVDRILSNLSTGAVMAGEMPVPVAVMDEGTSYESIIRDVLRETADQGNVIIVAHGAGFACAAKPGVLRLLVTASPEARVQHVVAEQGIAPDQATRLVNDSDKARQEFLRRFYQVDHELPTHYDLVINTDVYDTAMAARAVVAAVKG